MSHNYISNHIHFVFATKHREKWLTTEIRKRLWQYIGGIARENEMEVIVIGGYDDHCHALISLQTSMSLSKAAQLIKGGSSKWLSDTFPELKLFKWQSGYGAFSIGVSQISRTVDYINNQEEHHKKQSFEDELQAFATTHNLSFDKDKIFGDDLDL